MQGIDFKRRDRVLAEQPKLNTEQLNAAIRSILPPGWECTQEGVDGAMYDSKSSGLRVISSVALESDGYFWLHVSVSRRSRLPTWEDLRFVKDIFIGPGAKAIQVLPSENEYVNINPFVLHLWACLDGDPLPDFTRGTRSI